jgi:pyruvate kinase
MVHQMKEWSPLTTITDSVASSAVKTSWDLNSSLIIALTESGSTSRLVSKYRPHVAILCVTPHAKVARQALVSRGIIPFLCEKFNGSNNEKQMQVAIEWAKEKGLILEGEIVVIVAGVVEGVQGSTNMMRVEIVQ